MGIRVTENVGAHHSVSEFNFCESLNQVLEQPIAELLFVAPISRSKDPEEGIRIGPFDFPHSFLKSRAYVDCDFSYVIPMAAIWKHKPVNLWK